MAERRASCSCGQFQITTIGEPIRISICHCYACQKRTGSAFAVQARFSRPEVTVKGSYKTFERTGESGQTISFHFCPECGSTVAYFIEQDPEVLAIPVGAFADKSFPAPTVSVYEDRQHPWVQITADVEHYD
jgi:hypothetical protein